MTSYDHRKELLRTQAVQACLTAMGGTEARIYGTEPFEWSGTVLNDDSSLTTTTHWRDSEGLWRYEVVVEVRIVKTRLRD